ncbi:hypothetical protein [Vibrio hyugaensis]|uniref:hypothetical protein n=1 Tax=Vibrio hyugaensis TaxID=1534743 RepID=UPI003DA11CEA
MKANIYPVSYETLKFNDGLSEIETQPPIGSRVSRVSRVEQDSLESTLKAKRIVYRKVPKSNHTCISNSNKIIDVTSFEVTQDITPLRSKDETSTEHSIDHASNCFETVDLCGVRPDKSTHVSATFLHKLKKGSIGEAIKQAYDGLPSGVLPKVIGSTLASAGFIAGIVACAATGGAAPLVAATVIAGITAFIGAGDALRAYQTRHHKEKPFSNDGLGYLINKVGGDKHRKIANGISSGLRIGLFAGSLICFAVGSTAAVASSSAVRAPEWTHTAEGVSLLGEACVNKVELHKSESKHNVSGCSENMRFGNEILESTKL